METQSFWEPVWLSIPLTISIIIACGIALFFMLDIDKRIRNYKGIYRVDDKRFSNEAWSGYYLTINPDGKAKQFGKEVRLEKGDQLFKVYLSYNQYSCIKSFSSISRQIEKEIYLFKISIEITFKFDISEEFDPQLAYEILVLPETTLEKYLYNILDEELNRITITQEFDILLEKMAHGEKNEIGLRYQMGKMINTPEIAFKNIHPAGITMGSITLTI